MADIHHAFGVILALATLWHTASSVCAPEMKGEMCKDTPFPPNEIDNCIPKLTEDLPDWPCRIVTPETSNQKDIVVDLLERFLAETKRKVGTALTHVLDVSADFADEHGRNTANSVKGCEEAGEKPTVYSPNAITGAPYIRYQDANERGRYLLVMVDPDAPCGDKPVDFRCFYLHWMVADIPGSKLKQASQLSGNGPGAKTLVEYLPPSPPAGPAHRYQLLLFDMTALRRGSIHDYPDRHHRARFDLTYFVAINSLCHPRLVAGFQFLVQLKP